MKRTASDVLQETKARIAAHPKNDFVVYVLEDGDEPSGYVTGRNTKLRSFGFSYRNDWQLTEEINEALSFQSIDMARDMLEVLGFKGRIFTRAERGGVMLDVQIGDVVYLASDEELDCPMTVVSVKRRNRIVDTMEHVEGEDLVSCKWFCSDKTMRTEEFPTKCILRK